MQRPASSAAPDLSLELTRGCQRLLTRHGDKRVDGRLMAIDPREARLRKLHRRYVAAAKKVGRLLQRQYRKIP